jgi:hypothetical protein
MNIAKTFIVLGIAVFLMPWARLRNPQPGQKVAIQSLAFNLLRRYRRNRDY